MVDVKLYSILSQVNCGWIELFPIKFTLWLNLLAIEKIIDEHENLASGYFLTILEIIIKFRRNTIKKLWNSTLNNEPRFIPSNERSLSPLLWLYHWQNLMHKESIDNNSLVSKKLSDISCLIFFFS